jgi:hypothetical protein
MPWEAALQVMLESCAEALENEGVSWAIVGSVASALQGCRVTPGDIDFLVKKPEDIVRFTRLMAAYVPERCDYSPEDADNWHSSRKLPVHSGPDDYGFTWHFARWVVEGTKLEAAHIEPPEGFPGSDQGGGIWEAGPELWGHVKTIPFAGYEAPVAPLEIQLGTNMLRGLQDRVREIVAIFQARGYDRALVDRALRPSHLETFEELMSGREAAG